MNKRELVLAAIAFALGYLFGDNAVELLETITGKVKDTLVKKEVKK